MEQHGPSFEKRFSNFSFEIIYFKKIETSFYMLHFFGSFKTSSCSFYKQTFHSEALPHFLSHNVLTNFL